MLNFIKKVLSPSYEEEANLEEEENKLLSDALSDDSFLFKNSSNSKICYGIVTFLNYSVGVIDHRYHCHRKNFITENLSLGDYVTFDLYEKDGDVIVKNVQRVPIPVENPVSWNSNLNESVNDECNAVKITGIIAEKTGRKVMIYPDNAKYAEFTFDMNNVTSEFLPLQDDLVELEVLISCDKKTILSVNKVSPLTSTVKRGIVTSMEAAQGVISNFAIFSLENCEHGYNPVVGDKVLASLIRSNNSKGYLWRAIQVIKRFNNVNIVSKNLKEAREDLVTNREGIIIPVLSKFFVKINTLEEFVVEVENQNNINIELKSVFPWPYGHHSQISLVSQVPKNTIIPPNQKLKFIFKIEAKFIGYTSVEYIWEFPYLKIPRMFELEVISAELKGMIPENLDESTLKNNLSASELMDRFSGCIMPGQPLYKRISMMPVQLGQYALPNSILVAALPDEQMKFEDLLLRVEEVLPCLKEDLCQGNYYNRFSGLIFLEEVEHLKQLGELFIERGHFRRAGKFLILEVPRFYLYASRLISGDKIIASLPCKTGNFKYEGIIHHIVRNEIWINFSQRFHNTYVGGTEYSISFVTSRVPFRRMHQAISLARKFLGYQWLFPRRLKLALPQIIIDKQLDEYPLGEDNPRKSRKKQNKTCWNRHGSGYGTKCTINNVINTKIGPKHINEIKWFNTMLNPQQKEAVCNILKGESRPLPYIIFGPPGTGKSLTIVESVLQLHSIFSNSRILVATPSNSAADLLTDRLTDLGQLEQAEILRLVGVSVAEQGRLAASITPYAAILDVKNDDDQNRYYGGIHMIGRDAVSEYRVIIGTIGCIGALFNMGFPRGHFTHIIVDEAGQATEPEILTTLVLLNADYGQVILAGDPFQLGPVVYSKISSRYGLEESLLVRFLDRFPYKKDLDGFPETFGYDPRLVTQLVHNYRSIPSILRLTNMLFYDNNLIPQVSETIGEESALLLKLGPNLPLKTEKGSASPVIFHGVRGKNCQEDHTHSWYNPQEVYQVFVYLNLLYDVGISPDEIGIISPYNLQSLKIRHMLEELNLEAPKIGSIEEFQGQEKMIIILSVVRSSLEDISYDMNRAIGFVRNPKRLNVAISRARALLIIIGDPHFLSFDSSWKMILKHCIENNYYIGCDLPHQLIEN